MKYTWNQLILQPAFQSRPVEQAGTADLSETQFAEAIRARANRLYMVGELARAAQLLMELEMQPSWAS
jgi:hypothetical protein